VTLRNLFGALSLVAAAGLFVAGCSSLPTSPMAGAEPPAPVAEDPAAPGGAPAANVTSASRSGYVRAALGGTVSAGGFHLVVPPGALEGDAIITVRQPDVTKPVVELSITPEERNGFLLPVLLVADARPLGADLVATSYMSWWNPDAAAWEPCPGSAVSVATLSVQAPLWHFSTYRVEREGKAGW